MSDTDETVLGIDPGTTQSAYALWSVGEQRVLDSGIVPNREMFGVIRANRGAHVAVEMVASYGMAVGKTTFETVVWIGQYLREAKREGAKQVSRVFRMEEKMSLCHNSQAKDANIRQALIDRYGEVGTKRMPGPLYGVKKDIWAALAVAVTYAEREKLTVVETSGEPVTDETTGEEAADTSDPATDYDEEQVEQEEEREADTESGEHGY